MPNRTLLPESLLQQLQDRFPELQNHAFRDVVVQGRNVVFTFENGDFFLPNAQDDPVLNAVRHLVTV